MHCNHISYLIFQVIQDEICIFTRHDQKEVVFYSPKNQCEETVPGFANLLPEVSVFAINDEKIDDVLVDCGFFISSSSNHDTKKRGNDVAVNRHRKGMKLRKFKDNMHVDNLQLYS